MLAGVKKKGRFKEIYKLVWNKKIIGGEGLGGDSDLTTPDNTNSENCPLLNILST